MSSREKEERLMCSLCKDTFREPKTLGCLHSFCLRCLEIYIQRNHSTIDLPCPVCRTPFQSKSSEQLENLSTDSYLLDLRNAQKSLNNLPTVTQKNKKQKLICSDKENEATHYCLDCQEYYCEVCSRPHQTMKITKNHQVVPIEQMNDEDQIKSNSRIYCQIHQQKEMELFCDDCNVSMCSLCISQHPSHKILVISDIIENEKQLLIDLINQVKPKEKDFREGITKCESIIRQLEVASTTTQTQINRFFNEIRTNFNDLTIKKEQEFLKKLDEIVREKKEGLKLQKEELKFGIESVIGSCQIIEYSLSLSNNNKYDNGKLLSMRKLYQSRLDYLATNIWRIEPNYNPSIEFLMSEIEKESIYSNILNIGSIDSNDILAEKCLISRNKKQIIFKDEEFNFEIICYSKEGNQMKIGGNGKRFIIYINIEGEQKYEKQEENECEIVDLNNGKYEVKMKLKNEGKHSIFVQYDGLNINSSPFQIQVFLKLKQRNYNEINQPKLTFGSHGNWDGQFNYPYGVTINLNGNIIVGDNGNHRIQIFDFEGKFLSTFGSQGNGDGQFYYPFGVTTNSKGNIIVFERANSRIQIFDSDGKFISKFGSFGYGNGQFTYFVSIIQLELNNTVGICVDLNDRIYACDFNNHRIQIFDSEGKFISKFGSHGNGNGQFENPRGIAINSKGNIIVCDNGHHRIQIFDSKGKFLSMFGSKGNENGQFNNPSGICVDVNDNIFVCDYSNNRIQVFNSNGEYITQFGVNYPTGITIDPNTLNIIVCGNNQKISIF